MMADVAADLEVVDLLVPVVAVALLLWSRSMVL
jgi:hypothetical protein